MKQGKVYLVGAGPGDPGLLTIKGLDCLKQAEVIIYDRLLEGSLLTLARPDAEKIYAGKSTRSHAVGQEAINKLLIAKAKQGKIVVRLKGGDPFVLGRGGEEAEALAVNNIPFEVVPGVSSAVAAPAYAGIPVTHRHLASSFAVITGHEADIKGKSAIAWDKISTGADTLIFLMGVSNLKSIVKQLVENGRNPKTPVAIIINGTTARQQVLVGTLEDIVSKAEQAKLKPPAVMVVGEVVRLRENLNWFDSRPLFGKRVLVTRARRQARELSQLLLKRGAVPVETPVIKIKPLPNSEELKQAILNLKNYHWIIFTSVNGVEAFFNQLYTLNLDARWLKGIYIGAIGPATARALGEKGLRPDCVPQKYTSQGLLAELKKQDINEKRVLLPRAQAAGKTLALGLISLGAEVDEVAAYRTLPDRVGLAGVKPMLLEGEIDIVTLTSSSTVTSLLSILGKKRGIINALIACIGPETEANALKAGLRVDIVAKSHTMSGLVEAIEKYFSRGQNE